MVTADFFRARIDAMINLNDPLAVLATRLPWAQIEASLAAKFERPERAGQILEGHDMFGSTLVLEGAGTSNAGRPKLPIRLRYSRLAIRRMGSLGRPALLVPAPSRTSVGPNMSWPSRSWPARSWRSNLAASDASI